MPVVITCNFNVRSGVANERTGTLISARFRTDTGGHRYAVSYVVHAPDICNDPLPYLDPHYAAVLEETVDVSLHHPSHRGSFKLSKTDSSSIGPCFRDDDTSRKDLHFPVQS